MTAPLPVLHEDDPDQWVEVDGEIVANLTAAEYAASYAEGEPHPEPPVRAVRPHTLRRAWAAVLRTALPKLPLTWLPAYSIGGTLAAPAFVVVHCTESDNTAGSAEAIAGPGWFGGPKAGTSAHKVVDVDSICEGVKRTRVAWHAGAFGNTYGIAYEFCGRAAWSAAKWREPAQLQMLRNAAPHIADDLRAIGAPARWLSVAQTAAKAKGLCTHNDIRLAAPGTTSHTDPGPGFPYQELLDLVAAELGGAPAPAPAPAPGGPVKPGWALPAGHWLGNVAGGATQHGGVPYDNAAVQAMVRYAQQRFIADGDVPGVTDWRGGWADAKWEAATDAACRRWFAKHRPGQQYTDRIYADDWAAL